MKVTRSRFAGGGDSRSSSSFVAVVLVAPPGVVAPPAVSMTGCNAGEREVVGTSKGEIRALKAEAAALDDMEVGVGDERREGRHTVAATDLA